MAVARRLMVRTTPTRFEVNSWRAASECDLTGMGTVDEPGLGLADQRSEHVAGAECRGFPNGGHGSPPLARNRY